MADPCHVSPVMYFIAKFLGGRYAIAGTLIKFDKSFRQRLPIFKIYTVYICTVCAQGADLCELPADCTHFLVSCWFPPLGASAGSR